MAATESEIMAAALAMPAEARAQLAERLLNRFEQPAEPSADEAGVTGKFPFVPLEKRVRFWVRPRHEALDRAGEGVLAKLNAMRAETIERGEPL